MFIFGSGIRGKSLLVKRMDVFSLIWVLGNPKKEQKLYWKKRKEQKNMNETPFKDGQTLKKIFSEIAKMDIKKHTREIVELVIDGKLSKENIQNILRKHSIRKVEKIKPELLGVLIAYANFVLEDNVITDNEKQNFEFLKMYFVIREGDFYKYKLLETKSIINKQLERLYADNLITQTETESNDLLQEMFDLHYDQFDKMKENLVIKSIEQGAEISNLDTANTNILKTKSTNKLILRVKTFFGKK